jgi:hypothetical protein
VGTCLFAKALLSEDCVYMFIKNMLPSSGCCFVIVSWLLPSNGTTLYNINMDLGEIRWNDMDWVNLVQDMN